MSEDPEAGWVRARLISTAGIRGAQEQETRATSALLAVMHGVPEFGSSLLRLAGGPRGTRTVDTYAEIRLKGAGGNDLRPDGAAVVKVPRVGRRSWLIEVKTGTNQLDPEQVDAYLDLAKDGGFDGVLTISNQITASPAESPVELPKKPGRQPVRPDHYHLSWWRVLTEACVQHEHRGISDPDQAWILGEFIEYLDDPKSGVVPFRDMGPYWAKVRDGARRQQLQMQDPGVPEVVARWDQLVEYLCLCLFRDLGRSVEVVRGKESTDERRQRLAAELVEHGRLAATIRIADAAAAVDITADLHGRVLVTSVELGAPKDRKQPRAAINWMLRQLRDAPQPERVRIDVLYPYGKSSGASLAAARDDLAPLMHPDDRTRMPRGFRLTVTGELATKGRKGDGGFIEGTRASVATFYRDIVQGLSVWRPQAPKLPAPEQDGNGPEPVEEIRVPEPVAETPAEAPRG